MRWNMEKLWQKVSLRAKEAFSRILLHMLVGHSIYVEAHRHSTCGCEKLVLLSATFTPADRDSNVGFQTLWLCSCFIFSMAVNAFNSEVVVKATTFVVALTSFVLLRVLFCMKYCFVRMTAVQDMLFPCGVNYILPYEHTSLTFS